MNARTTGARHRAARRPLTPLTGITRNVGTSTAGRRAAVVATAGGLLVSSIATATAAQAAPVDNDAAKKLSTVDLSSLTDQARSALQAAPTVAVAADATVDVEAVTAKIASKAEITPAPEPEPEPEPVVESTTSTEVSTESASRSAERVEAPDASSIGAQAVSIAMRYVGTPYVVGGASPSGMDCSGLTTYVYDQLGIDLPRTSSDQRYAGYVVSDPQPGDLVWTPGHIAIYAGDGKVIEASRPLGWEVGYRDMWQSNPTYIRVTG